MYHELDNDHWERDVQDILSVQERLTVLLDRIHNRTYRPVPVRPFRASSRPEPGEPNHTWRGADVRITRDAYRGYKGSSILITSRHAPYLGGLFKDLLEAGKPALDFQSKYEWFGRVGEAIKAQVEDTGDRASATALIVSGIEAACAVANDWLDRVHDAQKEAGIPSSKLGRRHGRTQDLLD